MTKKISYQTYNTFEKIIQKKVHTNYLLYLPVEYKIIKEKKWPCIIFLHGGAEQGDDLNLVKKKWYSKNN